MTPQERLDYLLATTQVPSNRGRLTHTWVAENISLAVADGVFAAVKQVSEPTALRYSVGNGIDTTAALWKQQAIAVAASNNTLAPHLNTLKDFELLKIPRWQIEGYDNEPTLEQITIELAKANWRVRFDAALNKVDTIEQMNGAADLRTIADEMELV
jgi:hypothetical protein